jgi:hypothetical protein
MLHQFYKATFGLKELCRNNGNAFPTDGYIHVAVLKTKGEEVPDIGAHRPHFTGVHRFGFECRGSRNEPGPKLEAAHGLRLPRKMTLRCATGFIPISSGNGRAGRHLYLFIDVSHTDWERHALTRDFLALSLVPPMGNGSLGAIRRG